MILNRSRHGVEGGDNSYRCQKLQAELKQKPIRVAQCIIADCSDSEEAFSEVLEPILDYLVKNVESIETEYRHSCQKQLDALNQNISIELDKANFALSRHGDGDVLFEQLFEQFWRKLTTDLEHLLAEIKENRHNIDSEFEEQVKNAIQRCQIDTGIPQTCEEIAQRRHLFGSYDTAYNEFLHEIRTNFLGHFLSLDKAMQLSLENRKYLVVNLLKAHLANIADSQGLDFLKNYFRASSR